VARLAEDLWNVDKHRHLYLAVSSSGGGFLDPGVPMDAVGRSKIHIGPVQPGTVLVAIPLEYAAEQRFLFRPSVELGSGVLAAGQNIESLMHELEVLVSGIIGLSVQFVPPEAPVYERPR
jgi:hypothetical protein